MLFYSRRGFNNGGMVLSYSVWRQFYHPNVVLQLYTSFDDFHFTIPSGPITFFSILTRPQWMAITVFKNKIKV